MSKSTVSWISSRITRCRNSELSASQTCACISEDANVVDGMDMGSPLQYRLEKEMTAYALRDVSRRQVRPVGQAAASGSDLALGVDQRVWRSLTARLDQAAEASNFQVGLRSQFLPRSLLGRLQSQRETHQEGK